ncbi:putative zinc metallopeptidase [Aspergillus alliaceus]|uniref:putative zinc metallopeptidase n=1 Tax=Petromyces alliaceus TaxID=209559 RepID=UPI0012A69CF3|nr:uncharacterized protein BDW43DRAFT_304542 [Aspergillus alliaceus]KAB8227504.1 hypothetical protein BDW43DRAFT_304542 [Aspergillus alliaceus]
MQTRGGGHYNYTIPVYSPGDDSLRAIINRYRPKLEPFEDLYRYFHSSPELSSQEEETSAIAVDDLRKLEYEVHTHIGGYGVAGILRNGDGLAVLLRADMDALPLEEKTGLPYASRKVVNGKDGVEKPVIHACGHDTHVTSLMAGAELLHAARDHWSDTVIYGLYEKIPKPDVVLSQHVMRMKTGTVSIHSGRLLTSADAFDVCIYGRGGHGSALQTCIDPIGIGATIITRLQTIVSREVILGEMAVVSCGSIQAGHAANIIPDQLDLKFCVQAYDPKVRERVLSTFERIIEAECQAAGVVEKPLNKSTLSAPATINDKATSSSVLATSVEAPEVAVDQLSYNHHLFTPVIRPTICTTIDAIALGALTFLKQD